MKRKAISLVLAVAVLSAFTCSKNGVLSNASDVLSSLRAAQPLVTQLLPSASASLAQSLDIAGKLKDAIAHNDATNAAEYLRALIPVFEDITEHDVPQIKDEGTKTRILTALALADIGLSLLANHYKASQSNTPAMTARRADPVSNFAAKAVWGRKYRK